MSAERGALMDGKAAAEAAIAGVAEASARFAARYRPPHLAVVIVGENPASQSYVKSKVKAAERCGIDSILIELRAETSEAALLERIGRLNDDPLVDGILVQMPLPPHIDQQLAIERISPAKDVDGLHPYNIGRLAADRPRFIACTPLGIVELLARYRVRTSGARAVVIGRSVLVGKPMALLLSRMHETGNATVTLCHSQSTDLVSVAREADILVAAVGRANAVGAEMVKEGAVVIDVGINRIADSAAPKGYRIGGDVDFEAVRPRASLITPVPGGVGPMTVAMLMRNTLQAAEWARGAQHEGNPAA
jgi:methylenetetrahydrofolate dehydrogenase (NADP+)/methenyltetrahydrofolate cyclohydrolase